MRIELAPSGAFRLFPKDGADVSIEVPNDERGLRAMYRILSAQQYNGGCARIGTESFPTQAQLKLWIEGRAAQEYEKYRELYALDGLEIEL